MDYVTQRKIRKIVKQALKTAIKAEPLTPEQLSEFRNGVFRQWYLESSWERSPAKNAFFQSPIFSQLRKDDPKFEAIAREYWKVEKVLIEAESSLDEYLANATGEQMF